MRLPNKGSSGVEEKMTAAVSETTARCMGNNEQFTNSFNNSTKTPSYDYNSYRTFIGRRTRRFQDRVNGRRGWCRSGEIYTRSTEATRRSRKAENSTRVEKLQQKYEKSGPPRRCANERIKREFSERGNRPRNQARSTKALQHEKGVPREESTQQYICR